MLRVATPTSEALSSIEEAIEEFRNGRMIVLVDDEERENEGDLVIPAQLATPETINFMAKHGRGLICLALQPERCRELGLELMPKRNDTAFTVSIEAREGVTTGISASDRSRTVMAAIDPASGPHDIVSPGHVFPLMARDGGVLVRAGHTEAGVDMARLAGLNPSAVICEIMNDDGSMARMADLEAFAQRHAVKVASIADLISYRLRNDTFVERIEETELHSRYGGDFKMYVYANTVEYSEHIVLVKGDISDDAPVLVRVHDFDPLDDLLADSSSGHEGKLQAAMRIVGEHGRGVVIIIREPRQSRVSELVRARHSGSETTGLRDYGVGAQILRDLGIHEMILLHNTEWTIVGLDGYGLKVVDQIPIPSGPIGEVGTNG